MKTQTRLGNLLLKLPDGVEVFSKKEKCDSIYLFDKDGRAIKPEYAEVGLGYERNNGKHKVTLRISANPENISTNLRTLLLRYHRLYAIDTNKKKIDCTEYCVSCRMAIVLENKSHQKWWLHQTRLNSFIFTNPTVHEELIGWKEFFEHEVLLHGNESIGVIIDHDLGNMPLYNQREKGFLEGKLLPENVDLVYASAERDLKSPLNQAIKQCDSDSNVLLNQIKSGKMTITGLIQSSSGLFDTSGYLVPKNNGNN